MFAFAYLVEHLFSKNYTAVVFSIRDVFIIIIISTTIIIIIILLYYYIIILYYYYIDGCTALDTANIGSWWLPT